MTTTSLTQAAILKGFGSPESIGTLQKSVTKPKANEVRIRIEASSITVTDTLIRKGLYPLLKEKPPFTLGYDFVGRVEAVGDDVTNVKLGDRVADICQIGGNATHICRPANTLLSVPEDIEAKLASSMVLSGMTAYQIFKRAKLKAGQRFLVHGGSGAVGSTLLKLCKLHGIETVTTASTSKHSSIQAFADVIIDYNAADYYEQLKKHAKDGFDAALDFTNQQSFNNSFNLLKPKGILIASGIQTLSKRIEKKTLLSFILFTADFIQLMLKLSYWKLIPNQKSTLFFGILSSKQNNLKQYQRDLNELFELIQTKKLEPLIGKTYGVHQIAQAHIAFEKGSAKGNLIMLNNTVA